MLNNSIKKPKGTKLYPGYRSYAVSKDGYIVSLKTGKILKGKKNGRDILCVYLYNSKGRRLFKIHRLVAMLFVLNPYNLPYATHLDRNKSNCAANNLKWVTIEEGMQLAFAEGSATKKLSFDAVKELIQEIHLRKPRELAVKYGVTESYVRDIRRGKNWKHLQAGNCTGANATTEIKAKGG